MQKIGRLADYERDISQVWRLLACLALIWGTAGCSVLRNPKYLGSGMKATPVGCSQRSASLNQSPRPVGLSQHMSHAVSTWGLQGDKERMDKDIQQVTDSFIEQIDNVVQQRVDKLHSVSDQ